MTGTLKTDEVIVNKIKYFIIEYIRAWNLYHVETSLHISLCLLYGRFFMILIPVLEILNRL